ncbi:hypothetical protein Micbo1qcDRAFT_191624 [Microdochium bolleyi]|uniref:Uncharacterized protein n=1 Tax=Microdochium bolleyi TaxID=196109 RepID=A0A136JIQ2_9PEZI|nr:hypothetical protein Micbo1qcDRAFT_191624 [Microdochium bolleyi]
MLNRRLTLLTFTLCFVLLVCYTLGGSRIAEHVVLIPTDHQGKGTTNQQPGTPAGSGTQQQQGHSGSGSGHEHLHNNLPPAAGVGGTGAGKDATVQKPGSGSSSSSSGSGSTGDDGSKWGHSASSPAAAPKVEFVVSATKATNTTWIGEHFPSVPAHVYIADDPRAPFTVLKNIGHESNVYLTYIIDHYDELPDVVVFLHGRRYQWHNEDPLYDGVPPLQKLRIPYVLSKGFATLRCSWLLGCPLEIKPDPAAKTKWDDPGADQRAKTEAAYAKAFKELFPSKPLPEAVGVHCGAQFATTRERIRANSVADYVSYRDWLWTTELTDEFSGRVMEYSWHLILGAPAVDCPHAGTCFCEKFGMCDLAECHDYGCEKTYFFNFGELPEKWPAEGSGENGWPVTQWADPEYTPPPPPPPPPPAEKEAEKKSEDGKEGEGKRR